MRRLKLTNPMAISPAEFKKVAIIHTLRSCQVFAGLPREDLEKIAEITVLKRLEKGEYLFHEGTPTDGFYIVQSGAINIHRINAAGKEQVIHIYRPGESFAEATLATETGFPADARALDPSQVLLVQKAGMLALIRLHPELALRMLGSMSLHLRFLLEQIEDLTSKDVEMRLANWLLKQCPRSESKEPVVIELPVTKRMLAAELGTVSETFSRTLAKMRDQELLSVNGKTVTVLNPSRLSAVLEKHADD